MRRERWFYLFISPWLLRLLVFQIVPISAGLSLSLVDRNPSGPPAWVGLKHIVNAAADPATHDALLNTGYYAFASSARSWLCAGAGNSAESPPGYARQYAGPHADLPAFRDVGRGCGLYVGVDVRTEPGYCEPGAKRDRGGRPGWFTDPLWAMPTLILLNLWGIGGNVLIYLAALQTLPHELHEAAMLDGAGTFTRFRHITLPMLSPISFFIVVVTLINAFQQFTPAYLITRGGPQGATLLLGLQMYLTGFQYGRFGEAAALAVFVLLLTLGVTLAQFRISGKWVHYTL